MKQTATSILIGTLLAFSTALQAADKQYALKSPNGRLEVKVEEGAQLSYSITLNSRLLLDKSAIGLITQDGTAGEPAKVTGQKRSHKEEEITSPNYRFASFETTYNELDLKLKGNLGLQFRAYNEGVAYRFYTTRKAPFVIQDEVAEMNFAADYTTYMAYSSVKRGKDMYAMAFQNTYEVAPLSKTKPDNIAFLPITVDCEQEVKMTLLESDLESYPGLFIAAGHNGKGLRGTFARYPAQLDSRPPRSMTYVTERKAHIAEVSAPRTFPWRAWAITEKDTDMPTNNLVYALASPNRIGDCSWIKPGKVAWDWWNDWGISGVDFKAGINMPTYKHYIDFAAENKLEFIVLDEGWYNPAKGDMLTVIPQLDLPELVRYGKQKGVDIILWTVFNVLDDQLEEACRRYSEMGISGFKVDFLDRDDQTAVEMIYRIAAATAKHHLSLNLHGTYKPTGLNRTFPNILNFESVFGMEEMKWSKVERDMMAYDVVFPYIRMMAGPVDYTPGAMRNANKRDFRDIYYNPMSQGTRCHQLATYIVHDSPLTMLADNPTAYRAEQECTSFIASLPNHPIQETRILQGKLGEYIVSARRIQDNWYVGGLTDWTARDITLDFSFLPEGSHTVTLFRDGANADKQATDYRRETFAVTCNDTRTIHLAPGGGFALSVITK